MAAVDYFLKLDGVEGESADAKHKGEIELASWSFGATQGGTFSSGGGGGAGKVSMQDNISLCDEVQQGFAASYFSLVLTANISKRPCLSPERPVRSSRNI